MYHLRNFVISLDDSENSIQAETRLTQFLFDNLWNSNVFQVIGFANEGINSFHETLNTLEFVTKIVSVCWSFDKVEEFSHILKNSELEN